MDVARCGSLLRPRENALSATLKSALPISGLWTRSKLTTRALIQSATPYCRSSQAGGKAAPSESWLARFGWAIGAGEASREFTVCWFAHNRAHAIRAVGTPTRQRGTHDTPLVALTEVFPVMCTRAYLH
jgi:hypothetical protein